MTNSKNLFIAGPCAVESREQILDVAYAVKDAGAEWLRGGAYKPRTSPEAFQGLGMQGLEYLAEARESTGLKVVAEVLDTEDINTVAEYADVLQIGTRDMHNSALLKKIGQRQPTKPVLLKRGFAASKRELLGAINYLKISGHQAEILVCERGIKTFADNEYSRFILDCNLVADLKEDKNFPYKVLVDPSHPSGRAELVERLAYAGMAAGADGLMVEVSFEPHLHRAQSDRAQHITPETLSRIIRNSRAWIQLNKERT